MINSFNGDVTWKLLFEEAMFEKFLATPNPPGITNASKSFTFALSNVLISPLAIRADSVRIFLFGWLQYYQDD